MKIKKRAVAFLDILGFKQMLDTMSLEEISAKYENVIGLAEVLNRPLGDSKEEILSLFPNHPKGERWCIRNVFSDSVILVSEDETMDSVLKLLVYSWRLSQLFMTAEMPIRGGISFGEFYINEKSNVFLGEALTNAYLLESKQQWAGIAIDNSLIDAFPILKEATNKPGNLFWYLFPKYSVPLKSEKTEMYHVLNWRLNLVSEKGTRALFKKSDSRAANEKIENTLEFANYVISERGPYISGDSVPVELRTFYVGAKQPPFPHGDEF